MKKLVLLIVFPFLSHTLNAQVGIGNTNPNSSLDISASSVATPTNTDGILIPRIDDFPSTSPTINQDGMMVFVTGNGTPTKGFYYWDQGIPSWVAVAAAVSGGDPDWFLEGTTTAPSAITDDIFTQGNVAIGKNTADYPLDIEDTGTTANPILLKMVDNSTGTGDHIGIQQTLAGNHNESVKGMEIFLTNSGTGLHTGISTSVQNGTGNQTGNRTTVNGTTGSNTAFSGAIFNSGTASSSIQTGLNLSIQQPSSQISYGTFNSLNASGASATGTKYGVYNLLDGGSGNHYGVYNDVRGMGSNTKYGTYNLFGIGSTDTGGLLYGTYNNFGPSITSTLDKYGTYTSIPSSLGGTHYGIYSDARNASGYAGYFIGRLSLGSSLSNRYIMPAVDGTMGQVLTTDGSGMTSWQNVSTSSLALTQVTLSTTQSYSGSGQDIMNFDNIVIDLNSNFNTTTNRFTATSAGYYRISASYQSGSVNTTTDRFGINVWINGNFRKYSIYTHHAVGNFMRDVQHVAFLDVGDYVDIRMFGESAFSVASSSVLTSFEVQQIR